MTNGVALAAAIVFPVLFAAGMSLVDTTDGVMMLGACNWAFLKPLRKLYYNMTITLVSVVVALVIGGIEAAGLIADKFDLAGGPWAAIGTLSENFGSLGCVVIGILMGAWALSFAICRCSTVEAAE